MKRHLFSLLLIMTACGASKPAGDTMAVDQLKVKVVSFTQREEHPGVESDLISVTTWVVELQKKWSSPPKVTALLLGGLVVYPNSEHPTNLAGNSTVRLTFSQANYREGSQPSTNQPEPTLPPIDLGEGTSALLLTWKDQLRWVELPAPEVLPSVYYP